MRVFVNTSALIALANPSDGMHATAKKCMRKLSDATLVTSDYVLDETYTLLRRGRNGLKMTIGFHDLIESSRVIEIVSLDEGLREAAWRIFVDYDDKAMSFTDCTSFALMRQRDLTEAFSFDTDFQRAGFVVHPGL